MRIHLVDTPGHADFGGEVERVLGMVDAVLLAGRRGRRRDAADALRAAARRSRTGCARSLVVNKVDRPEQRARRRWSTRCSTCSSSSARTTTQLDFPVVYASAKEGTAALDARRSRAHDLRPLLEAILEHAPRARASTSKGRSSSRPCTLG